MCVDKKEKIDLRVIKTHNAIRDAFLFLLETKAFKDIQVQEIIDQALVNRSTFYKYYRGKNDLVQKLCKKVLQEYTKIVQERFENHHLDFSLKKLAPSVAEKSKLILALWKIKTPKCDLRRDMETVLKETFIRYAKQNLDPEKDWEYHGVIFAFSSLLSQQYYFEQGKVLPIGHLLDKWREVGEVLEHTYKSFYLPGDRNK